MTFRPRASGTTTRRPTPESVLRRKVESAVVDPHDASERFDPEFVLGIVCSSCGKAGMAPRRHLRAAITEHVTSKHAGDSSSVAIAIVYPKQ